MSDEKQQRPLRVVSVAHAGTKHSTGRTRYNAFARQSETEVHLVVPARWYEAGRWFYADPPDDAGGVTLHALRTRLPRAGRMEWYLHWYPRLGSLVKSLEPDVLHLWEEPWSVVACQAIWLKRRNPGMAVVLEVDQNILKVLPQPFEAMRRYVLARTSLVLCRSVDAIKVVRACAYKGPVQLIGYGVDQTVFSPPSAPRERGKAPLRIGYAGRLLVEKGLDDALEAVAIANVPTELSFMGEGAYLAPLKARAAALGVAAQVSFHPFGTPAEVAAFMRGLDVFALLTRTTASIKEQFGRVIIEAQSCGVPVIGSTSGEIANVIGEGGWVVPERDPRAVAALLERLAAHPDELTHKAQAARGNIEGRFTYAIVADTLSSAWRTAAAVPPARVPG